MWRRTVLSGLRLANDHLDGGIAVDSGRSSIRCSRRDRRRPLGEANARRGINGTMPLRSLVLLPVPAWPGPPLGPVVTTAKTTLGPLDLFWRGARAIGIVVTGYHWPLATRNMRSGGHIGYGAAATGAAWGVVRCGVESSMSLTGSDSWRGDTGTVDATGHV